MPTSLMRLPRTLALLLGIWVLSGCTSTSEPEGSCPCAAGWTCCPDSNLCVTEASRCEQLQPKPPELTAPSVPRRLTASPAPGRVVLTWFEPEDDGDSALTGYGVGVEPREDGQQVQVEGDSASVTGLRAGGTYRFTVVARNAVGVSPAAVVESVKLPDVPGAPRLLSVQQGDRQLGVEWEAPSSDGGSAILHYVVTARPMGRSITVSSTERSAVLEGLTNGVLTTFTVRAVNAVGEGPDSVPSKEMVSAKAPGAPVAVSAIPNVRGASISWSAPEDTGGLEVSAYVVTASPGGTVMEVYGPETHATFTRLWDGTEYTFTVAARNARGQGPVATSAAVRTPSHPGAPASVRVEPGERSLAISWAPPVSDNGSALTGFTVLAQPSGTRMEVGADAREVVMKAVPSTHLQVISVTAHNAVGPGDVAVASSPVRSLPAPPEVLWLEAPAEPTGCLSIKYGLMQEDAARVDILVEVDPEGDGVFQRATQAGEYRALWSGFPPTDGLESLSTWPWGQAHAFRWNRSRDVPGAAPLAQVRVTATVPGARPVSRTLAVPLEAAQRRCDMELDAPPALALPYDSPDFQAPLTSGDFDQDGRPDLIIGTDYPSGFSYLWGRGNGGFELFADFETSSTREHLVATDMDGDGVLDLIAADPRRFWGESVSVYLGRGNGDFREAVASRVLDPDDAAYLTAPVATDLDGDERPEFVVSQANRLVVLRHTGEGKMAVAFESLFTSRGAVVTGDFDEDGRPDMVVVGSSLEVFRGRGRLEFTREHLGFLEGRLSVAHAADFDRDGHLDIAALSVGTQESSILLLRGDGEGRFGTPSVLHHHAWKPSSWQAHMSDLAAHDLDADGVMDLAYVHVERSAVTVLRGVGDGTFAPHVIPTTESPIRLAVADFDGSGRLDIAVFSQQRRVVSVIRDQSSPLPPPPISPEFATGDFDGDGWKDVASWSAGNVQVHLTRKGEGLVPRGPSPAPPRAGDLLAGRFDAGPTEDLLMRTVSGTPAVYGLALMRGMGDGTFSAAEQLPLDEVSEGRVGYLFAAGDVDGDGDLDVVFQAERASTGYQTYFVHLLRNRGDGTFEDGGLVATTSTLNRLVLTDLNKDGRADLVVLRRVGGSFELILFEGRVDGTLRKVREYTPDVESCDASALLPMDLNRDDWVDLLVSCGQPGVLPLIGRSGVDFAFFDIDIQPAGVSNLVTAAEDLSGDGMPELLSSDLGRQTVCIAPSRGGGFLLPTMCFASGVYSHRLAVLDVDHDGVSEVLVGDAFDGGATSLLRLK
ncbi:FG-GAP-like repeat-containing protein [Myxococcus stipitatus]|uniref:FG-GAP-like repeat-containing protein n=1 Tax=Myxococcus stipitatus TaxID=83455 RepID=UPI003144E6E8